MVETFVFCETMTYRTFLVYLSSLLNLQCLYVIVVIDGRIQVEWEGKEGGGAFNWCGGYTAWTQFMQLHNSPKPKTEMLPTLHYATLHIPSYSHTASHSHTGTASHSHTVSAVVLLELMTYNPCSQTPRRRSVPQQCPTSTSSKTLSPCSTLGKQRRAIVSSS